MKKKLVLVLTLGVSMVPSVLFAMGTTGESGGRSSRLGAICQGTTATYAQKDNGQELSSSIRPMQDGGGVTSALDSGPTKGSYVH